MPICAGNQKSDTARSTVVCVPPGLRRSAEQPQQLPRVLAAWHGKMSELYTLCVSVRRATSPSLVGRPQRRSALSSSIYVRAFLHFLSQIHLGHY
jgi:hypothetical protein